jgi:hypothetical protein
MNVGLLVFVLFLPGCAWLVTAAPPPPRPSLPEVRYVDPHDPKAVAGLTAEAVEALRKRDMLLQRHLEALERQIQGQ